MRFYVYALCRPGNPPQPFYIGKGSGDRMYRHDREARGDCKCHKCNTIRKLWREGLEVVHVVLLETDDEQEAYQAERNLIARLRPMLTNVADGGEGPGSGEDNHQAKLTNVQADEIRALYAETTITVRDLAARYGVSERTITSVVRQEHWGGSEHPRVRSTAQRGELRRGERSAVARLTWEQVRAIRTAYVAGGVSVEELRERYGVTVDKIVRNQTWHDPDYTPPQAPKVQPHRVRRGEQVGTARLTWDLVNVLRARYATEAVTCADLAGDYGIDAATVVRVVANKTWHDPAYTPPGKERRYTTRRALSTEQAEQIRALHATGRYSYEALAQHFGCAPSTVWLLINRP